MFSIHVDWQDAIRQTYEESEPEWTFVGMEQYSEKEREDNPDLGFPMMNFAYPIYYFNGDEKKIRKVQNSTNCTVVYNNWEDKYYLALTGGGMDLSQDIAMAYMLITGYIEWDLIDDVYIHGPLSVSEFWYKKILRQLKKQFKTKELNAARNYEDVCKKLKEYSKKRGDKNE